MMVAVILSVNSVKFFLLCGMSTYSSKWAMWKLLIRVNANFLFMLMMAYWHHVADHVVHIHDDHILPLMYVYILILLSVGCLLT